MQSLFKQVRVRRSGLGQENKEEPVSTKDRRILPQRTQSFKAEKKRGQNWFRKFSWQMSHDYDSNIYMEHVTAVAAAAYAINSLQESKKTSEAPQRSLTKLKSKKEDATTSMSEIGNESERFPGEGSMQSTEDSDTTAKDVKAPDKAVAPAPSIIKAPTSVDETRPAKGSPRAISFKTPPTIDDGKMPEKAAAPAPSIKRTPTFPDKQFDGAGSMKPESEAPKHYMPTLKPGRSASQPDTPPTVKPAIPSETREKTSTRPRTEETKADAWEKAELAKINERYEKVKITIQNWEEKKRTEARRKLNRRESEQEQRRVKARQRYNSAIESIEQIAGGARAQAEERRRNEEFKAKEKANIIRTTGKVPKTCFCF